MSGNAIPASRGSSQKLAAVQQLLLPMRQITILLLLAAILPGSAEAQRPLTNAGFEIVDGTNAPPPWLISRRNCSVTIDSVTAFEGARSAGLDCTSLPSPQTFGSMVQAIDPSPYRGKRVLLRAAVRADQLRQGGGAGLWLRVDRPGGERGFFDNMSDRRITDDEWKIYEIVGDVVDDAAGLNLGLLVVGSGRAWLDAVSLSVVGEAPPLVMEEARTPTARGLENLIAFTRLLGYVRFFHPSDEAAATDWDEFTIEGIRAVEGATEPDQLASTLQDVFRPIAPTITVRAGSPADASEAWEGATAPSGSEVVMWRHLGAGFGDQRNIYRSDRIRASAPHAALADSFPGPPRPFVADLGGGVSALIPFSLYADSTGTLPRVAQDESGPELPALTRKTHTANDRATRLAGVALAWNVFQHFYPYFDVVEIDWQAQLEQSLAAAALDTNEFDYLKTLRRLVAALDDGHAMVNHASDQRFQLLPLLWEWIEGQVVITAVGEGVDGLQPGDVVLRIAGRDRMDLLAEEEGIISSPTPQWRRYRALQAMRASARAGDVELEIVSQKGKRRTVTVSRSRATANLAEPRPEVVQEVEPGIWYVDLDRVTTEEFRSALSALAAADGLVFDLRGYPTESAREILQHLIEAEALSAQWLVPVVTRPDGEEVTFRRSEWHLHPLSPHLGAPRVFITDGRAISYAESVMGIVEHYRLGEIVGAATAGTNGNVNPFTLPGGYVVNWTGMRVLKHDGSPHHGVGIAPTIPATRTIDGVASGRDELLEAAIAALRESL